MLYLTTRNQSDAYTAYRALHEERAQDNGMFVPFKLPVYSSSEIAGLKDKGFCQVVADILNAFFSAKLTAWDIECCIGRNPVKLVSMSHRLVFAQTWHNLQGSYAYSLTSINNKLCADDEQPVTDWARLAVRIAYLFGLYSELLQREIHEVDIAADCDDFEIPMAAWYAREMGLPIGTITFGCDNSVVWDLLNRGELNTAAGNAIPNGLERFIYATLGAKEALSYCETAARNGIYKVPPALLADLGKRMFAAVVGRERIGGVINSFYSANSFLIDPKTALAFSALQDYRAKTGDSRMTLLLSDKSPEHSSDDISQATGLTFEEIARCAGLP